jgi:hypothetical protein
MARDDWPEEDILMALHLRDHEGMMFKDIGARLGRTASAVIGLLNRINNDTDKSDPDGNQNGTMKPLWWKKRKGKA